MKQGAPIRTHNVKREQRHCAVCDSTKDVEANHVGGRNHVAWFTSPLCRSHHDQFHAMLRQAGVDLRYTADPIERYIRAMEAKLIFEWMLLQTLRQRNKSLKREIT